MIGVRVTEGAPVLKEGITINLKDIKETFEKMWKEESNKYTKRDESGPAYRSWESKKVQNQYEIKFIMDGKNECTWVESASSKEAAELYFRMAMRAEAVPEDYRKWKYYEILSITRKD